MSVLLNFFLVVVTILVTNSLLRAAEMTGTVQSVEGSIAMVNVNGERPAVGARAEFFFQIAGSDISVASGQVVGQDGSNVKVQIQDATGDVLKDHLVRFAGGKGEAATAVTPAALLPPSAPVESAPTPPAPTSSTGLPPSVPFPTIAPRSGVSESDEVSVAAPYVNKGNAQYSAGDIDGAIASYTDGIRVAPSVANIYLNRANAYLFKPNFKAAITDANKALELKVAQADDAYVIRGTAKAGLGDSNAAMADCNRALKINPNHALAYNNRANNKLRGRNYAGALADCNKSISLNANFAPPYYNRGFAYLNTGNPARALSDWKTAVRMQPSFGAELNPKIAQLEAQGIPSKQSQPQKPPPSSASGTGEWTDLTNAPQKMVGTWQGGRHRTQYFPDGTFVTDPHLVPNPPRGQWQVQGDRLVQYYPLTNETLTNQILSIDRKTLVIRNAQGQTFRLTKLK